MMDGDEDTDTVVIDVPTDAQIARLEHADVVHRGAIAKTVLGELAIVEMARAGDFEEADTDVDAVPRSTDDA